MYGRILDLLDISVKTPVISALAQFWSSDLHCFELPNLDLVPTLEEYMRMARLPIDDGVGVYSYRYETQGLNPIPAILADTFLSMELKRTQVIPVEEQLEGICFQYDVPDASQLLVRVRAAWRNVQRKGDDELGKQRISASQEYNEWRKARGVPEYVLREPPNGEGSSRSSDETLKAMASELERARAQIKQLEEVEESAEWEIDALKRKCKKKDEQIERLEIQCETEARDDTKNWWGLARNYQEKNEELSQKVIKRKLKAKRKKQEADEAIEGWRLMTDFQRDKKKEWMKRCDDMADCVNYHSIELARRLGEQKMRSTGTLRYSCHQRLLGS
ncbi:hypothetical protein SESBI_11026 [Sesbania bispinosa]|nr:hypothetical protein SESBI_11026 [Sesbania bispinosa]